MNSGFYNVVLTLLYMKGFSYIYAYIHICVYMHILINMAYHRILNMVPYATQ